MNVFGAAHLTTPLHCGGVGTRNHSRTGCRPSNFPVASKNVEIFVEMQQFFRGLLCIAQHRDDDF